MRSRERGRYRQTAPLSERDATLTRRGTGAGQDWRRSQGLSAPHAHGIRLRAGPGYDAVPAAEWVAERFESERWRTDLSWSHHREVAALESAQADALLDEAEAEAEGWSRNKLRSRWSAFNAQIDDRHCFDVRVRSLQHLCHVIRVNLMRRIQKHSFRLGNAVSAHEPKQVGFSTYLDLKSRLQHDSFVSKCFYCLISAKIYNVPPFLQVFSVVKPQYYQSRGRFHALSSMAASASVDVCWDEVSK